MQWDSRDLKNSAAGSWGTGPGAWGRRHPVPTPCRPARRHRASSSLCPTWGSFWGCRRRRPRTAPLCWAGSRRRRSTCRLWSQPGMRKAWWRPRSSRNLGVFKWREDTQGELAWWLKWQVRHQVSSLCDLYSPWYMAWAPVQAKRLPSPLALRKTSIWSDCCSRVMRSRWYLSGTKWNWVWP